MHAVAGTEYLGATGRDILAATPQRDRQVRERKHLVYRGPHRVVNTDTVGPVGNCYLLSDDMSPADPGRSGGDCRASDMPIGEGAPIDPFGRWVEGRPQVTHPDRVLRQRFNLGRRRHHVISRSERTIHSTNRAPGRQMVYASSCSVKLIDDGCSDDQSGGSG
jgi:hypothetical protein